MIMQMTDERMRYLVKSWPLPFSTHAIWSVNVRSFMSGHAKLVRNCQAMHFPPLRFGPSVQVLH